MKKIGYILLLSLILLQAGGLYFVYKIQQINLKFSMLQKMEKKHTDFQKITLSLTDFQKFRINKHELSINGKMYDFEMAIVNKNSVEVLAVNDTKEETILKKIKEIMDVGGSSSDKIPHHILQLITLVYICPSAYHHHFFNELKRISFPVFHEKFNSFCSEIKVPPPKLV